MRDGKIVAVGALAGRPAKRTIDANGLLVVPGFIDLLGQSEYNVLVDKRAASKITQGITTEVTGEGASIAPLNDAMMAEAKDIYARYGYTPEFRTIGGFYDTLEKRGTAVNLGDVRGRGDDPRLRHRQGRPAGDSGRAQEDDRPRRPGDARGRARRLHVAPVRARHVQLDRRDHRDGEGRGEIRRRVLHAPALGGQRDRQLARRGLPDREGDADPQPDLAPEDRLQAQLGQDAGGPREDRGRARRGHRRHGQPVPLDRRLERPRRVPAALDPRGRARGAAQAPGGPEAAREGQEGDARGHERVGQPVPRRGRAGPGAHRLGPESEAQVLRGQDRRADRGRGEEGSRGTP